MLKTELLEIISNGENSRVEFKRDDIRPEQFAREIVAFLNSYGGRVLLGVEDDGKITGLTRAGALAQEWVLNAFRDKVHPHAIPDYQEVLVDDLRVGVISVAMGTAKPYALRHGGREEIFIRMGNRTEPATREQQLRLFEAGRLIHVETLPVGGTSLASLDQDRLQFYMQHIVQDRDIPQEEPTLIERLAQLGLMAKDEQSGDFLCTIAGIVCFGKQPRLAFRQAGIHTQVYGGLDKEYSTILDQLLDRPLVGRFSMDENGQRQLLDRGLVEDLLFLIDSHLGRDPSDLVDNIRRERDWWYPPEAVREIIWNACAHRDWTRAVDIEVSLYSDRMEVISPGPLPNSMTVEAMLAGRRTPRNPLIVDILRDYGYVDRRGMGIRRKVVPLMRNMNARDPIFEASEDYLKITLPKGKNV